jgi:tetratricopeptide (TPR) repeat protein
MSIALDPVGTLEIALSHAARLLATKPALAAEQAAEILKVMPRQPTARLLLALAKRSLGAAEEALPMLTELAAAEPRYAAAHCELGLLLWQLGFGDAALEALRRAVALEPSLAPAWLALGDLYTDVGDTLSADAAYSQHIKCSTRNPRLLAAGAALYGNRLPEAESLLRAHLKQSPTDVAALRMLAEVAGRLRRYGDARALLERCLELAPSFSPARHNLALVLHREGESEAALKEIDGLLAAEPRQPSYRNLKAAILGSIGEYAGSLALYKDLLQDYPSQAKVWMSYGHALKTAGHEREGIAAYRKSIELEPLLGEAYWSLANLKTFRFTDGDIDAIRAALGPSTAAALPATSPSAATVPRKPPLDNHEIYHFHFALGKALEDTGAYEESFRHYAEGNRLRRTELHYASEDNRARHRRSRALFTRQFFDDRAGLGSEARDPIFIVGLPRSGSTLLEQILASHSQVEGTMELPDITGMARALTIEANGAEPAKYPDALPLLPPGRWRELGEEYLASTRIHRKSGAPYFIDKMPNNFAHIGLIHLALPNSKIIDVRRHPLACCFSGFKQHFAMGQNFSYSLEDIGRYYHDYVQLMAHFDTVLPGRVHRVFYETLVDHTETEVRRVLDYCGLPFEDSCLRFYENSRAVRTASSEQVRRPIFRDGIDQWRHFEPWLAPLRDALGPVLERYPEVPDFA